MKVVIVCDELIRKGGAEQVTICLHKAFPDSAIYTTSYQKNNTYPYFEKTKIYPSIINTLIKDENSLKRIFFPFGIIAMRLVKVDADVAILSSTHCSKYVRFSKNTIVIDYCHTPFRLAWLPNSYDFFANSKGIKRTLLKLFITVLQKIDKHFSRRVDHFITNSRVSKNRIEKFYNPKNAVDILSPPTNLAFFSIGRTDDDYFLVVSRLEYYKRIDIVIDLFNENQKKLIIVGKGSQEEELKNRAKSNIVFKKNISVEDLSHLYKNCKALIFPQEEDYGITPLEANASGKPVIAFNKGGVQETMIPYIDDATKCSAILFEEQTKESLNQALNKFETLVFSPDFIREHALKFDEKFFIEQLRKKVSSIVEKEAIKN